MRGLYRLYDLLRNLAFVPKCVLCRERLPLQTLKLGYENCMCDKCYAKWKRAKEENCPTCLCSSHMCMCAPAEGKLKKYKMPKLVTYTPNMENTQGKMIFSLKRKNDKRISEFLGRELSLSICRMLKDEKISPDSCIFTYVPRRGRAVGKYGFDQGRRLCESVAQVCEGKCISAFVRRGGKEQKKLDREGRAQNISAAIGLSKKAQASVRGRTVVVIDDLVTTGETLGTAAKLLAHAGAANVYVAAIAKTKEKR